MMTIDNSQRGYTVIGIHAPSGRQTTWVLYKGEQLIGLDIQHSSSIRRQWVLVDWKPRTELLKASWAIDGHVPADAPQLAEKLRLALRTTVMA